MKAAPGRRCNGFLLSGRPLCRNGLQASERANLQSAWPLIRLVVPFPSPWPFADAHRLEGEASSIAPRTSSNTHSWSRRQMIAPLQWVVDDCLRRRRLLRAA
jgi:hypothetical protein